MPEINDDYSVNEDLMPLIERLAHTSPLSRQEARRVVMDVVAYLSETPDEYIIRRHRELRREGRLRNEEIFRQLVEETGNRVFAAEPLSPRQVRRMIYG